jgi:hypothetical protein
MQASGGRTPAQGQPPGTQTFPNADGGKTVRTYGTDGKAVTDVDYGHDHGAGDPHVHDWNWSKTPPRQPGRAPKAGEVKSSAVDRPGPTVGTVVGAVALAAVGTAVMILSGGSMSLQTSQGGLVLVQRSSVLQTNASNPKDCPTCT